jgi:hypothetical protein
VIVLIWSGALFAATGFVWPWLFPADAYWSEEQAQEYTTAQANWHAATHKCGHGSHGSMQVTVKAARDRFEKIKAELEFARYRQSRSSTCCTTAGSGLMIIGVFLYVAAALRS